ncbi:MAG: hypothetical protein QM784_34550 [Polyangiaceae bacterium]
MRFDGRRWICSDRGTHSGQCIGVEGHVTREQLVEGCPERPNVRSMVDVPRITNLLGRHVRRRSHHLPRRRQIGTQGLRFEHRKLLGDPEVEHLDASRTVAALSQKQIRRLEIPVDDPGFVSFRNGHRRLCDVFDGELDGNGPLFRENRREIPPSQAFHDHERHPRRGLPHIVNADDVIGRERRCGASFT